MQQQLAESKRVKSTLLSYHSFFPSLLYPSITLLFPPPFYPPISSSPLSLPSFLFSFSYSFHILFFLLILFLPLFLLFCFLFFPLFPPPLSPGFLFSLSSLYFILLVSSSCSPPISFFFPSRPSIIFSFPSFLLCHGGCYK